MKTKSQIFGTIKITNFALRHFDPDFGGTKILNLEPKEFENHLNFYKNIYFEQPVDRFIDNEEARYVRVDILEGYAPFCKLLVTLNATDAKTGTLPITVDNYQYLRSGYFARKGSELSVLSRWLELPVGKPKAKYTVSVLYSKSQIDKEGKSDYEQCIAKGGVDAIGLEPPEPFDADWGVVAILAQMTPKEEPMLPITMMRNYMHISMGGSGMKLPVPPDKPNTPDASELMRKYKKALDIYSDEIKEFNDKYDKSVKFWQNNAIVK